MSDAQKLTDRDAGVLRAIRAFFEANKYKTGLNFDEVLEVCPENIVGGLLVPILEHLVSAAFLRRDPRGIFTLTPLGLSVIDKRDLLNENTFTAFCDLLLVALADYTDRQSSGKSSAAVVELEAIAKAYNLSFAQGWIRRASQVFASKPWADVEYSLGQGEDGGIHAILNGIGLLEAERLKGQISAIGIRLPKFSLEERFEQSLAAERPSADTTPILADTRSQIGMLDFEGFAPASDRSVRLDDNAPGRKEAIEKLQELEKFLTSGSNELNLSADDRQVAVKEIKPFRERLEQRCVRIGEVYNAVTKGSTLIWLLDKVGGQAVAGVITAALVALGLLAKALIG
ncbi:MAG: hypothetical protein O9273_12100 [Acetobacteraceae bacterium]|jgi:hypothetical protein|nr:hypothetical protein [Acetobacteraceae bacterium]